MMAKGRVKVRIPEVLRNEVAGRSSTGAMSGREQKRPRTNIAEKIRMIMKAILETRPKKRMKLYRRIAKEMIVKVVATKGWA